MILRYKIRLLLTLLLLIFSNIQQINAQSANGVPVNINSGDPKFPFPQFLEYQEGKTLATYNAEGVTHCDMEKAMREGYQVMANRFRFTGESAGGVQYIRGNLGCPYDCTEGEGYALLAAVHMADRSTFNGLWMRLHDDMLTRTYSYKDGSPLGFDYRYGRHSIAEKGRTSDAAADGDWDVAMALLLATKQWDNSGVFVADGQGGTKELSYMEEAIKVITTLADTFQIYTLGHEPRRDGYVTGHIGVDGYPKGGNTFGENTPWGQTNIPEIDPSCQVFGNCGAQPGFSSYLAPAYYRSFAEFLESNEGTAWVVEQYKRAEASSEWIMKQSYDQGRLPFSGAYAINGTNVTFANGDPTQGKSDGEAFRKAWRTILNYIWRGHGQYQWDPVTHQYIEASNTAMYDNSLRLADFIRDPGMCTTLGASPDPISTAVNHSGIAQVRQDVLGDGTMGAANWTNFTLGVSAPAIVAAENESLLADLYRQLELKWDDQDVGLAEDQTNILLSEPKYFHGWFRLMGMMILTGNYHAPENTVPSANMKVYMSVDKTFAFVNDEITYEVDYRNYGSVDATNATITIEVSPQYQIVNANGGTVNGNTITYGLGTVPGYRTATGVALTTGSRSFTVRVSGSKIVDRVCQTATISCSNGTGWTSNEYPNNCTYTMERNCVDILGERSLKINKYGNRTEINPDMEVEFTIQFSNTSDGGWLNGGRNHVNFTYGWSNAGPNSYFHVFRTFTNAEEAYIDLSNYRISYYMFDNANKGIYNAATNPNGWALIGKNLQSGAFADFDFKGEDIPFGESGDGTRWNQRIIIQFPPDITAPTHTVLSHLGNRYQLHKGALRPIWYDVQMESTPPAPLFTGKLDDDWSFAAEASVGSPGNNGNPGLLVGPAYADLNNLGVEYDRFDRDACSNFFGPDKIFRRLLVEEFDGYTWRRVAGEGPLPGREMYNVVIYDTLPQELKFNNWIRQTAQGVNATLITSGGYEIIRWEIDKMLVGVNDSIRYTVIGQGECPGLEEIDLINRAWIESSTDSKTASEAHVKLTCDFVTIQPGVTTMTKIADKANYEVDETITYTIDFEQTLGTRAIDNFSSTANWVAPAGSPGLPTSMNNLNQPYTSGKYFYNRYSHGTNGTLKFVIDLNGNGWENFSLFFRYRSGVPGTANFDGVALNIWPAPMGLGSGINISCLNDNTLIRRDGTAASPISYPLPASPVTFVVRIVDDRINVWINSSPEEGLPTVTYSGINIQDGYVGYFNGKSDAGMGGGNGPGNYILNGWDARFDSAFELEISDILPNNVSFVSASNAGVNTSGRVAWPVIEGPVLHGTEIQYTVTGTVNSCPDNGRIVNNTFANPYGFQIDSIGAQNMVTCGTPVVCTPPTTASISTSSNEFCTGDDIELTATQVPGYLYRWYLDGVALGAATLNNHTIIATQAGTYTVRIGDGSTDDIACYRTSAPVNISETNVPAQPDAITGQALVCANTTGLTYSIDPVVGATTYTWSITGDGVVNANGTDVSVEVGSQASYTLAVYASNDCGDGTAATFTIDITEPLSPEVEIEADQTTICTGQEVTFTISNSEHLGTTPTYSWLVNGTEEGTNETFSSSTLVDTDEIQLIATSDLSCVTSDIASSNLITITVSGTVTPEVSIISTSPSALCVGEAFTAEIQTSTGGGSTPSYEWFIDGITSGQTGTTFSSTTLANGNEITLVLTSSSSCATTPNATSNALTVNIGAPVTPSVSITADQTTICEGATITFSIDDSEHLGTTPTYSWLVNGTEEGTNDTFSSSTLVDTDEIQLIATSDLTCVTTNTATSNTIIINVTSQVSPTVAITASSNTICAGETVNLSISNSEHLGTTPSYSWLVNGSEEGTGNSFSSASLSNGDEIQLIATSDLTCVTSDIASSNLITITVSGTVTPEVSIIATSPSALCVGESFTAEIQTSAGGGSTPSYEWFVDGTSSGQTGTTFSSTSLTNGNEITLVLTSSSSCATTPNATSNALTVNIGAPVTPSVSITADNTSICAGATITFSIDDSEHLGTTPTYSWLVNGTEEGTSDTFSSNTLVDTDEIELIATSDLTCVTTSDATSNTIIINVTSQVSPTVAITASSNTICAGETVNLSISNSEHLGTTPIYSWLVNGIEEGTNETFSSSTLVDTDEIQLIATSDLTCVTSDIASSNLITITVSGTVTPEVSIIATSSSALCVGEAFTAEIQTSAGGGSTPSYEWFVDGTSSGQTGTTFSSTSLTNGDQITLVLTSSSSCATTPNATSNALTVNIGAPVTPSVNITADQTTICAGASVNFSIDNSAHLGTNPIYRWLVNGTQQGGNTATFSTASLNDNESIVLEVTSDISCVTTSDATSNAITINVNPTVSPSITITSDAIAGACEPSAVTFSILSQSNEGDAPSYQWFVNSSIAGTGTSYQHNSPANNDQVYVQLTSNHPCATITTVNSNIITLDLQRRENANVSIGGTQSAYCQGQNIQLTALSSNSNANITWTQERAGTTINTLTTTNFTTSDWEEGDVIAVQLNLSGSCVGTATASASFTVNTQGSVQPRIVSHSGTVVICDGDEITLRGNMVGQWYDDFIPSTSATERYTVAQDGAYYFSVNDACGIRYSDTINVIVAPSPAIVFKQGDYRMLANDFYLFTDQEEVKVEIEANNLSPEQTTWTVRPNLPLSEASIENNHIITTTFADIGVYWYTVSANIGSCEALDSVMVRVIYELKIPNAFSPNGDNVNDRWEIPGIEKYPKAQVLIFNRWGAKLYQRNGMYHTDPWDGRNAKGEQYGTATYYYIVHLNDDNAPEQTLTGSVTLLD